MSDLPLCLLKYAVSFTLIFYFFNKTLVIDILTKVPLNQTYGIQLRMAGHQLRMAGHQLRTAGHQEFQHGKKTRCQAGHRADGNFFRALLYRLKFEVY